MKFRKPIKSLNELKKLCLKHDTIECIILLNGGVFSRKEVRYFKEDKLKWEVFNYIDGTTINYINDNEFKKEYPLFFEAIKKGALLYVPED